MKQCAGAALLAFSLSACGTSVGQVQSSFAKPWFLSDRQRQPPEPEPRTVLLPPRPAAVNPAMAPPTVETIPPVTAAADGGRRVAAARAGGPVPAAKPAPGPRPVARTSGRRTVYFAGAYRPGAIVVVNTERALYLVGDGGTAIRYPVAIGVFDQEWTGRETVSAKRENPTWTPVSAPGEPPRPPIPGGDPANPLGPRALYLGNTLWRIHGTPAPGSIGQAVSNGCIRMKNDDILDLYERVPVGAEVYVVGSLTELPPQTRGRKLLE